MALPKPYRVEPIWTGATAIVVCSGPSLSVKQLRAIARAKMYPGSKIRVIAVNDAIYGAWWADWLHSCDYSWWAEHIQHVYKFPGIKTTLAEDVPATWVTGYLQNTGEDGFDEDPGRCRTGANSGYQAMCIAIHAGVHRIALVGMDMKPDPETGETHYFGEHRDGRKANFAVNMIPKFETLRPTLQQRGVQVFNCTPDSALTTFHHVDLQWVIDRFAY